VSVVWCGVEISAMGRSLVQSSPTEKDASKCDLETSKMWRPRPTRAVKQWKKKINTRIPPETDNSRGLKERHFFVCFFFLGATAPSGSGPPLSRGF